MDEVLQVMKDAARVAIMPRFQRLADDEVEEKSAGEIVTLTDREVEAIITPVLRRLRPDAVVVGEEATAADPELLNAIDDGATAWLVDPLDGTSNFVSGRDQFAVMVALMEGGVTTRSWI